MLEELEEDTHLCIKCSLTIVGLNNYVRHRKTSCSKPVVSPSPLNREIIEANHSYREFEFTELDETHDHANSNPNHIISSPTHPSEKASNYKNDPNKSLSESYDYNDGLGADVFFSLLNLQSSSKLKQNVPPISNPDNATASIIIKQIDEKNLERRPPTTNLSHSRNEDDWIGTPSTSGTEKLMKAVNAISGTRKACFESPSPMYSYEYSHDHDSPEPPTYDDDDDDEMVDDEDCIAPPHTHTGGKWKPSERNHRSLQTSSARWYERWDIPEENNQLQLVSSASNEELANDDFDPPPSHTKGKWVPGTKIIKLDYKHKERIEPDTSFSEQFWCSSCNRKLSSRTVYERHLRSKLHTKRSQSEIELEQATFPLPRIEDCVGKQEQSEFTERKDGSKRANVLNRNSLRQIVKIDDVSENAKVIPINKRKRRCNYIKCGVCKTRLRKYLYGKHLISHYHYRRMFKKPDESFAIVLKNIHRIVHQSPYQCQTCRFYANTEEMFLRHWDSPEHAVQTNRPGQFWCTFCKFECNDNSEMRSHFVSRDHQEVLMAINRSVPIIIRKRSPISCDKCEMHFSYNIELRKHAKNCSESNALGTASNQYQGKHYCNECNMCFKSIVAYQRHAAIAHAFKVYFCGPCGLNFGKSIEAKRHRVSAEHKIKAAHVKANKSLNRKCNICNEQLDDLLLLKKHLKEQHPNHSYS